MTKTPALLAALLIVAAALVVVPAVEAGPLITKVEPVEGSSNGGTRITVTGTGFEAGALVTVDGRPATDIQRVSDTVLKATTPARPGTSARTAVSVVVTNPNPDDTTEFSTSFAYLPSPSPTISGLNPSSGGSNGGTLVAVNGANFASNATVTIGGKLATVVSITSGTILVYTPPATAPLATQPVVVTNPDGDSGQLATAFGYIQATGATITGISPASGSVNGGTTLTVTGTNFAPGALVSFLNEATPLPTIFSSSGSLSAVTPKHAVGSVQVRVQNPDGTFATGVATYSFTAVGSGAAPTVTGISPLEASNLGGTLVTVTGTNFHTGSNELPVVRLGTGTACGTGTRVLEDVTVSGPGSLTGRIPAVVGSPSTVSETLKVCLTNPAGTGAAPISTTNTAAELAPGITLRPVFRIESVSPSSGNGFGGSDLELTGTEITLTGTGFPVSGPAPIIKIGGVLVPEDTIFSVDSTELMFVAPPRAPGAVTIEILLQDGRTASISNAFTYTTAPAPTLTSVTPATSTTNGGVPTEIVGTNFQVGSILPTVTLGSTKLYVCNGTPEEALLVPLCDGLGPTSTSLWFLPPNKSGGTAALNQKVKVTNGDGRSVESNAADDADDLDYTATPAPTVTAVDADLATGGNQVTGASNGGYLMTITGTNFGVGRAVLPAVTIGGTLAILCTDEDLVVSRVVDGCIAPAADGTALTVIVPGHVAATTAVSVVVKNADGQTATFNTAFTYTDNPAPEIQSVTGTQGTRGGQILSINGQNFATGFQGLVLPEVTVSGLTTLLQVCTGTNMAGTVTAPGCLASTSQVLRVVAPGHVAGAVNVVVKNPNGKSSTLTNGFTYLSASGTGPRLCDASPPTSCQQFTPNTGPAAGGTQVVVLGERFPTGSMLKPTITVDTTVVPAADITLHPTDPTLIMFKVPKHDAGAVAVRITNPDGQSAASNGQFRYIAAPPTLTAVAPAIGHDTGGAPVTLTGTFPSTAALSVLFGDTPARITTASATSVGATSPTLPEGLYGLAVVDGEGQSATRASSFTVQDSLRPTFQSVSPSAASLNGGYLVTLTGQGFGNVLSVLVGGTPATGVVTVDSTTVRFVAPNFAKVTPARIGPQAIDLTNGDGQHLVLDNTPGNAGLKFAFTPVAGPTVTSISPGEGPATGGTSVTIRGTGFAGNAVTVTFDGIPATDVVPVDSTTITAKSPARPAGAGVVTVTVTSSGQPSSGTFTYTGTGGGGEPAPNPNPNPNPSPNPSPDPSTSSSSTSTAPGTTPTPAAIKAANDRIEVTVTRDGDNNVIGWRLPTTGLPLPVQGVQLWASNSPYALVETFPSNSDEFRSGSFTHTPNDAPPAQADTTYLVTMFYGPSDALGLFTANTAPDTQVYPGVASDESDGGGSGNLPTWAIVLILIGILFLIVLVAILVARGRNRESGAVAQQGYAWEETSEAKAADAEWQGGGPPAEVHQARCPACATSFTATGAKPIVTVCPGCGKKGILR